MPRLLSQRKQVRPPQALTDDRWKFLNLSQAQPNLGLAPTNDEGYTIQSDSNGKHTFTNTLGKLKFEDSKISNTQSTDITIDNKTTGNVIIDPLVEARIKGALAVEGDTTIDGQIVVKGDNPLGTFPVINNVLYVNENGDDANDGRAMDPSRAKRTISGAIRSPYYKDGTTIRVASGHYFEDNPIPLKPSTAVIGDDLRTTFIEPLNKDDDLFHVNSGAYLAFMCFLNLKKGEVERYAPGGSGRYITGAYCVAFPPKLEDPIDVYYSPYIQNCTNQSGPWLFDGTMFLPNQTVQVPLGAGIASWPTNTTTLTVAINDGSIALGMAINDKANVGFENSQKLLKKNKKFLQSEIVAWVNQTYPTLNYDQALCYRDVGLIIDAVAGDARFGGNLRSREAGLAYWEGTQSLITGEISETVAAVNHLAQLADKVIRNEVITGTVQNTVTQVIDPLLINGDIVASRLASSFGIVANLIVSGPAGLPDPVEQDYGLIYPSGLSADSINRASTVTNITSTSTGLANAQTLLKLNRSFIQEEVVEWVNQTYPTLNYDQNLCYRDVGLIVDAISIDGVIGGNIQSRIAGLKYYTGNTSNIQGEIPQTVAAIEYLGELAAQIIDNQPITKLTTATQVTNQSLVDGLDALEGIQNSINVITGIISAGPLSAPEETFPSLDQYVVTLDTPTVGHGNQSTIYFGYTTVYPVEDKNIPEKWVTQRSLNPSGSGGGALIDGNAPSLKSPIQSFVFDAFTQLNQGGIGVHITNNGYAQLVSVFTIFCDIGVLTENGGICSITNSNANFGNYSLVSKGYGKLEFSGIVWNPKFPTNVSNGEYYPLGYWPQNGKMEVYIPDLVNRPHIALIMEVVPPKTYIDYNGNRVPYLNAEGFPGYLGNVANTSTLSAGAYSIDHIDTSGIAVGHTLYIRDIEGRTGLDDVPYVPEGTTVVDIGFQSVTLDKPLNLNAGDATNSFYFNLYFCGNAYYTILSSEVDVTVPQKSTVSWVNGEENETAAAIRYARDIVSEIITNTTVTNIYETTGTAQVINPEYNGGEVGVASFNEKFNIIADMIQFGQNAAPTVVKNTSLKTSDNGLRHAAKLIDDNKTFIQEQVTAFVDTELVGFTYDQAKCFRDTGLIVDSVAFDILYGGTSQSTFAGLQYWNQADYTGRIPEEIVTTTNTILYVKDLAKRVVKNDTSGMRYQNTVSQVTNLPASDNISASLIANDFKIITDILSTGTAGVTDLIVPNGIASTDTNIVRAYNLLQANKEYIQNEAIAFVEASKNVSFNYDRVKCARDTGILLDSFVTDLLFSDNGYTQSNFAGLQYWDQAGYTGQIADELTTTTNAINYVKEICAEIVQNITTGTRYQSTVTQTTGTAATVVEANYISGDFDVIVDILTNGTIDVTDKIVANGYNPVSSDAQKAFDLLQSNKSYIVAEAIAYIESTKTLDFTYDQTKCARDVGYMIDSVGFDTLYGGNRQAIQSGVYYYGFSDTESAVPNEQAQVTAAYTRLKAILPSIITNQLITPSQGNFFTQSTGTASGVSQQTALELMVDKITNIINNGPSVADTPVPVSLTKSTNALNTYATELLLANKDFIVSELISYIDNTTESAVFVYDRTKCARDSGIIVDSIIMDVLYPTDTNSQSNFAGLQYWNQDGYVGQISNELTTTTNAINYVNELVQQVILNVTTGTRYQSTLTQVVGEAGTQAEVTLIDTDFNVILDILNNGTAGVTDLLVANNINPSLDIDVNRAYTLILENKEYIQAEAVAYVEATKTPGFSYDMSKCYRDVGHMVDSVAFDLLHGGNRQAIQSGVSYYGFSNVQSAIPGEQDQTVAAFNFIKAISRQIVQNIPVTPYQDTVTQVLNLPPSTDIQGAVFGTKIDVITRIISSGTVAASELTPISLTRTTSTTALSAAQVLDANREFIQAEVIAYLDQTLNFNYDPVLCYRDVGYMIDSVSFDLLHGGNRQAVHSGVYYYGFDAAASAIEGQRIETQFAYNHISDLTNKIISGEQVIVKYQSTVTQVSSPAASVTESVEAQEKIGTIVDIIANGPSVADPKTPISLTASTDPNKINAFNAILANKEFIQAETIAYVNASFTGFSYDKVKCARDTGIIIDSLGMDLLYNGSTQSNFAGLQYWNQGEYTGSIAGELTTTTAAINYVKELASKVVRNVTSGTRYQSTVTQVTNLSASNTASSAIIEGEFDLITQILNSGTVGITDMIVANGEVSSDINVTRAYALLQANKSYIQHEAIAFVEATKTGGFEFDRDKCARDVGYILDGVLYDVALGTNYNAVTSGKAYQRGIASSQAVIDNELVQTTSAIEFARDRVAMLVESSSTCVTRSNASFNETLDIILNNTPDTITFENPVGGDVNKVNAKDQLLINKDFIKTELTDWIDAQKAGDITPFTNTFTYDVSKCERDVGDIVDALCYDVLYGGNFATTIAARAYFVGAVSVLPLDQRAPSAAAMTQLSSILQQVVLETYAGQDTSGNPASSVEANRIADLMDIIVTVITDNSLASMPLTVYPDITWAPASTQEAVANISEYKNTIIKDTVDDVRIRYGSFFNYNQANCLRDTGLLVDAAAWDLLHDGVSQSNFAGLQYWKQAGYTGAIAQELTTTTSAINYMAGLISSIVNTAGGAEPEATFLTNITTMIGILENGTVGVTDAIVPNGYPSTATNIVNAYNAILSTKNSVITQTINWINTNNTGFSYDQTKCERDLGFIIDSSAFDLLHGGNRQSIMSGVYYYGYNSTSTVLVNEVPQSTAAFNKIKEMIPYIVTGQLIAKPYQPYIKQVVSANTATSAEATALVSKLTLVTDIINQGPDVAYDPEPISLTASTSTLVQNAFDLLLANREFIKQEVISYVNSEFVGPAYNRDKCRRDTALIVEALAQDLLFDGSSQSNFAGLQYWTQKGYTGEIQSEITTTTNAISFVGSLAEQIVIGETKGLRYASGITQKSDLPTATQTEADLIKEKFDLLIDIMLNGVAGVTDRIVPNSLVASTDANIVNAYNLLIANKVFLQSQAIAFVEATKTAGFSYDSNTCYRDIGYITDSIAFDLLYGGNRQTIQSAVYYYGFNAEDSAINNEMEQTSAAYNYIKFLAAQVMKGDFVEETYQYQVEQVLSYDVGTDVEVAQVNSNIDLIVDIINNGPTAAGAKTPIAITPSSSEAVRNAATLLELNKEFIIAEVIAYINYNFGGFQYNKAKCFRDVGYMIDSVSFDLLHGGNRQAIQSGVYYYSFNEDSTAIPNEIPQTVAAYNYLKALVSNVVIALPMPKVYQTATTQVVNLSPGTNNEVTSLSTNIELITNIISAGPSVAGTKEPISLTASNSVGVQRAYALLMANKQFIIDELTAYIDATFVRFNYNRNKCYRDVDSILNAVVYDVLYSGNYCSVNTGNGYFSRKGRYHIVNLEENVQDPTLFVDGSTVNFYQRSYQSASGYLFEYIGAGTNYSALPQIGRKDPIQSHETVQLNNGKVFFTSTDQNGDFRIGPGLVISQATGVLYGRTFEKSLYAQMTPFILVVGA